MSIIFNQICIYYICIYIILHGTVCDSRRYGALEEGENYLIAITPWSTLALFSLYRLGAYA